MSDSMEAVTWVNDEDFGNLNMVDIIYDIRSCLSLLKNISVQHISRDSNSVADSLAKRGSSHLMDMDEIEWRVV